MQSGKRLWGVKMAIFVSVVGTTLLANSALADTARQSVSGVQTLSKENKNLTLRKGEAIVVTIPNSPESAALEVNGEEVDLHPHSQTPNQPNSLTILANPLAGRQINSVRVRTQKDSAWETVTLKTIEPNYPHETLSVDPNMVRPPKDVKAQIAKQREEIAKAQAITISNTPLTAPFQMPLKTTKVTSPFGIRRTYNGELKSHHSGVDFRATVGTPVFAPHDGVVKMAQFNWYSGGHIIIEHGWGVTTSYFHLSNVKVKPGGKVKQGQLIAKTGDTGRVTGPHLHWGVHVRGVPVNPLQFQEDTVRLFEHHGPNTQKPDKTITRR